MRNWPLIYTQEIKKVGGYKKYLEVKVREKSPLLKRVVRYATSEGTILEAGCGTGVLSTYLSNRGYSVIGIDIDEDMIKIAKSASIFYTKIPSFKKQSLFKLTYPRNFFDVVFSHGVLEHFLDKDIIKLLSIQLKIGKTVIVSIPSNYFKSKDKMYGDERFMSVEKWKSLISQTSARIVEVFDFHYLTGVSKFLHTVARNRLFSGPKPYLTFVLQKA